MIKHGCAGCNFNVEKRNATGQNCNAVFKVAIKEKPAGRLTIRNRTRVVQRHPKGDW